ncbi:hypothetical protein CDL12_05557 [Handroanthus impetiginosus]|uniref:GTD-binding domain-containing protein n=1 Tax=Handroanthus impetiginosus TaxID=429701 RepID=A0A2G9HW50_9LAMI|nr:hypothetical protein CDL12_05557 [Handroanthus impetiginosus]
MAANKFATILHRNTNKITLILIYAVLEWILIVLLLSNSLFSYLIIKFAEFFGLKPPCLWCTRLDHIFDPAKRNKNMHRDLLCEVHAKEISKLGYCSNHHKLAKSQDMCDDCLSSRPDFQGFSKKFAFFPWMKEFGVIQNHKEKIGENGEVSLNCSCCGVSLENTTYSSYILLKASSWDVSKHAQKENLITEAGDFYDSSIEEGCDSDKKMSDFAADSCHCEKVLEDKNESLMLSESDENVQVSEKERKEDGSISVLVNEMKELRGGEDEKKDGVILGMEENIETVEQKAKLIMKDKSVQGWVEEDAPQHLEFFLDCSGHGLIPVELVDTITEESQNRENVKIEDHDNYEGREVRVGETTDLVMKNGCRWDEVNAVLDLDINEEPKFSMLDSMEMEEDENSLVFHAKDCHLAVLVGFDQFPSFPLSQSPSKDINDIQEMEVAARERHLDIQTDSEELAQMENNENEADISIGTDIPDLDITDEVQNKESVHSYECAHEERSISSANLYEADEIGPVQVEEQMVEFQCLSVQDREPTMNNWASIQLELNDIEEDKIPDTPTSVESLNQLHKKLLFLEKRDSGTEESLDGSITSELEGSDGVVAIECLKSALRAERRNLQALYDELEEERNASAVAANQTMAMINRLQEEKAAMQMEALQYQRMMEEQSEYDQEALQLLNELMVKREKEKQELEKELEVCKRKLLDYEKKEKIRILKKGNGSARSGFSSASCSNAEDSDGLSIDLNQEAKEDEGSYSHEEYANHNTPVDAVMNLEESLADFEEERLSILAQLRVLEEKLMTLEDDDEQQFEYVQAIENFDGQNGIHGNGNAHVNGEANGHANGFGKDANGKHHQQRRIIGQKGKSLLPLFEAISDENDVELNGNGNRNEFDSNGAHNYCMSKFEMENKKFAIEEEVDHLYERLQALETDREFLKHCVSSLKKGNKGMDLLQEILQHLRDLRSVELRARNLYGGAVI